MPPPGAEDVAPYAAGDLLAFARKVLEETGLPVECARDVAEILVEGDLLGHATHGLALLGLYQGELRAGRMGLHGEPALVADHGTSVSWDGNYLPGPWLLRRAAALARARLAGKPSVSVTIARSHHIACLQAYLKPLTDHGLIVILACTDPGNRWVAPPGAVEPVYSPNPLAAGIPTRGDPILVDLSLSTTSANRCIRAARANETLPGKWLVDENGEPTEDPGPLVNERKGGLLPLGGIDLGYKGFGLSLLLEAITSGLGGHGRSSGDARWGCSVFLQLIDPVFYGGTDHFLRETTFLADACRQARVPAGRPAVRLPGERALAHRRAQLKHGISLGPATRGVLEGLSTQLGIPLPEQLS